VWRNGVDEQEYLAATSGVLARILGHDPAFGVPRRCSHLFLDAHNMPSTTVTVHMNDLGAWAAQQLMLHVATPMLSGTISPRLVTPSLVSLW
jgi:hypothetical protein